MIACAVFEHTIFQKKPLSLKWCNQKGHLLLCFFPRVR
ncbi:Uncharacterised protein [Vibrio cholerae]|nr:Uncharacterised protein [Vibrio cholerae]